MRSVRRLTISVGCNDGETGNYTLTFVEDGNSSMGINARCGANISINPNRRTRNLRLRMNSGGGGDNWISFQFWRIEYR